MVAFNPLQRQVDNLDFANNSQFRFQLLKIPTVEYFVTEANITGITFGSGVPISTPFSAINMMGDTLEFESLEITFLCNEDLSNYREIHDWMVGIGFPKNREQFENAVSGANPELRATPNGPQNLMSDATMHILTNKNNPVLKANFKNCFPTSLSGLTFTTQNTDTEQLTATVTFVYDIYEFEVL